MADPPDQLVSATPFSPRVYQRLSTDACDFHRTLREASVVFQTGISQRLGIHYTTGAAVVGGIPSVVDITETHLYCTVPPTAWRGLREITALSPRLDTACQQLHREVLLGHVTAEVPHLAEHVESRLESDVALVLNRHMHTTLREAYADTGLRSSRAAVLAYHLEHLSPRVIAELPGTPRYGRVADLDFKELLSRVPDSYQKQAKALRANRVLFQENADV